MSRKRFLRAEVGQSYESVHAAGSLYTVVAIEPGPSEGITTVVLLCVVPAHRLVKVGTRIKLGTVGGNMWGLAYVPVT